MSMKYLGRTLDIHGGGLDLQFPHHENELAQSESYTGQPFARYWMHNGLLKMGHSKMAGSVGNVVNVADLLAKHQPETVRFLLLSTHYRSPIEYSDERLAEMRRGLEGFYRFFERYQRITGHSFFDVQVTKFNANWTAGPDWNEIVLLRQKFFDCMDDDFNTAGGIGVLFELLTALNRLAEKKQLEASGRGDQTALAVFRTGVTVLRELSQVLGLFWEAPRSEEIGDTGLLDGLVKLLVDLGAEPGDQRQMDALMQRLLDLRAKARKAKNFAVADQIRKRLTELRVTLEDRPGGTGWRVG
jgi:cysteinyl-tRNA synthetase